VRWLVFGSMGKSGTSPRPASYGGRHDYSRSARERLDSGSPLPAGSYHQHGTVTDAG